MAQTDHLQQQIRRRLIQVASETTPKAKWFFPIISEEPDLLAMYVNLSHIDESGGGAVLSVIHAMVKKFKEGGRFLTQAAEDKAGWVAERMAAGIAAGGFGRPDLTAAQVAGMSAGGIAGGRARQKPAAYGRFWVCKCEKCD